MTPGTTSRVVNAYGATFDFAFVSLLSRVDLPTLGSPMSTTVASPDFFTSKPMALPGTPGLLLLLFLPQLCEFASEQAYVVLGLLVDLRPVDVVLYLLDLLRYAQT